MIDPELFDALAEVIENPAPDGELCRALGIATSPEDFTSAFDFDLPPFASFFLSEGPVLGGSVAVYISEVLGTYLPGWEVPPNPDRLSLLLRVQARLRVRGACEVADALGFETLGPWLALYGRALGSYGPHGLRPLGALLCTLADALAGGFAPGLPHLLATIPPQDMPKGLDELATVLLSSGRSGVVLTRSWLHQRARERNVAMRIGGRSFAFRSLLGTTPRTAVAFLDELAAEQSTWWQGSDPISDWWRSRLERTRAIIGEIASELPDDEA